MQTTSDSEYVNVYILTKNGNEYSDEGCEYLIGKIAEMGEEREILLKMGDVYNQPKYLAKELKENEDVYPNNSSWETLSNVFTDYE